MLGMLVLEKRVGSRGGCAGVAVIPADAPPVLPGPPFGLSSLRSSPGAGGRSIYGNGK